MSQATLGSGPYRNSSLFSGYYLDERVADLDAWDCDEEAEEAFEQIRDLWNQEGTLLPSYKEDELIDTWIAEVLDILGYGTSSEVTLPDGGGYVDRLLFESEEARRESAKQALDGGTEGHFSRALSILEAKQWDADFEKFFSEQRSYRDASHQIKYYLERTPGDLNWGILTDGKKWRLYGTKDYETQTYYEVDLPEILEGGNLEAFKYFYVFFRPGAFVETAGSSFLDDVWSESETAAQELGEDLQDNVFRALRVLGKGFVESNDLEIDPDDEDGLSADELKEQSLVLLYRLMFVLYAESRGLIDPDDPAASEEYQEYFSLEAKREEIIDDVDGLDVESGAAFDREFSDYSSSIWGRLTELFELIDEGEEDLDIPPYNGGLFSREDHAFLDEYEVKDPYIAEVIFWLSTTENDEGEHVPADYADLDTRHLGSIYEGLLEHEFRIAGPEGVAAVSEDGGQVWKSGEEVSVSEAVEVVNEGGLYVVNDEGERKATGAYYTPDYVVTYIVEETVDPLVDEIRDELQEEGYEPGTVEYAGELFQRVQNLSVLDPAMGSGHFLTKATGYLSKQVMDEVRALDEEAGFLDEQFIRREISKEVIYGVDINEMAVELSKLSMWLETLAADQPLAFLDHHMKAGNSLVGSDITEVLSEDGGDDDGGQLTLTQALARVRQETLEHVMELMSDLLAFDNDSLESIKSMEELYSEIREDPLYQRLFELANVHTAEEFGCDVPEGAYEQMAGAIEDEEDWAEIEGEDWFTAAQATAEEQDFFHWELEFPAVFFDLDGEKLAGAGFDAVMGNPPYVKIQNLSQSQKEIYSNLYSVAKERYDLYGLFAEKGETLTSGELGYILPNKFFESNAGAPLRKYLAESGTVRRIVDFGRSQVFTGVSTYTCLLFLSTRSTTESVEYAEVDADSASISVGDWSNVEIYPDKKWSLLSVQEQEILSKIESRGVAFDDIADQIFVGIQTSADKIFVLQDCDVTDQTVTGTSKQEGETVTVERSITKPYVGGDEVDRYLPVETDQYLIYPYNQEGGLLSEKELKENYPRTYDYLLEHRGTLEERGGENQVFESWYAHWCPRVPWKFEREKILIPEIVMGGSASYDWEGEVYHSTTVYSPILTEKYSEQKLELLGILNSSLVWYYIRSTGTVLRGGYYRYKTDYLKPLSFPLDSEIERLDELVEDTIEYNERRSVLNTTLTDYIDDSTAHISLSDVGLAQPISKTNSGRLTGTSSEYPNLRVGSVTVDRESPNTVLIKATARYKPDDEDAHETDQWGYTETDLLPAFRITDLTETEADLIEHFVPVAVDEAGGFANFRETATKTNSLVDRLKAIELPDVDDVADDLENYLKTVERTEELDEKIEKTDDLIDEIVYELYGLTDEEIEIVEDAVGSD